MKRLSDKQWQARQEWKREDKKKRRLLNPLRLKVNKVLRATGIEKVFVCHTRIRLWSNVFKAGWETSSDIWGDVGSDDFGVSIKFEGRTPRINDTKERQLEADKELKEVEDKCLAALKEAFGDRLLVKSCGYKDKDRCAFIKYKDSDYYGEDA